MDKREFVSRCLEMRTRKGSQPGDYGLLRVKVGVLRMIREKRDRLAEQFNERNALCQTPSEGTACARKDSSHGKQIYYL
jgi:hypothetical protein